jgi:hypothetical protein
MTIFSRAALSRVVAVGAGLFAAAAPAAVTPTDLQVAARALSFMENPLIGSVRVGIVYAPENPRSVQQAEELGRLLGGGLRAGSVELKPELVKLGEVRRADVDLYVLTEYVGSDEALAAQIGRGKRPCVTTDLRQVQSGACLMGVRSAPSVEIVVNRAAAKESGITFATWFRVMITEI